MTTRRRGTCAIGLALAVALVAGTSATVTASPTVALTPTPSVPAQNLIELAHQRLDSIRAHSNYRAWTNLDDGALLNQAQTAPDAPLRGMVLAIKDNIDLAWLPTAAGANVIKDRRPTRNATVVDRLLQAGALLPGHTNMDTWARGVRSVSETVGATANARNPALGPMGSSGGTAVAVALGDADAGLGTDTCGSIRYPSAANLLYGLRPTTGLVSRAGVVPLSPTQDVVGPIAPSVATLTRVLDVIAGPDDRDPLTLAAPTRPASYAAALASPSDRPLRVGIVTSLGSFRPDATGTTMLDRLRSAGVTLINVTLPSLPSASVIDDESLPSRRLVVAGADERRWLRETLVVANPSGYRARLTARSTISARLVALLDERDLNALVYPTTPYPPALRGAAQPSANCHLSATSGLPALAIPNGLDARNVPVPGIDALGRPFDEITLLRLAKAVEAVRVARP